MNKRRRQFIAEMAAITGLTVIDGFGLLKVASAFQSDSRTKISEQSKDIKDYPHITDVLSSQIMESHFPIIVTACSEYLVEIPFLIELEVCKIWKESLFEWDAISNAGAIGLQQLMEVTANAFGLAITSTPELEAFKTAVSEYSRMQKDIAAKRRDLYNEAESGAGNITRASLTRLNQFRSELSKLNAKKDQAHQKLRSAKNAYAEKIHGMSAEERKKIDPRFVPELATPAGVKCIVKNIMECKKYFGGPVEMNIWRGIAAYNAGLQRTKEWKGLPYIGETIYYTRDVIYSLTKMLELKNAYSTKDANIIAETKKRIGL